VDWLLSPLLYLVSFGAIAALFATVIVLLVWLLLKLRKTLIRALGGSVRED
jgi:hypothetical protein